MGRVHRTKKDRRHSGRKITKIYDPVNTPLEETRWDDWSDYRDSVRGGKDRTLIRSPHFWHARYWNVKYYNLKNKMKEKIRKAKKSKKQLK